MSERIPHFGGSMAESYDRYFVPLLFEPYARDLANRLASINGEVLELACGTGVVTREIAQKGVNLLATDLSPKMLEYAQAHVPGDNVSWQPADALTLPFEDGRFGAVVCQFGVMFFPDKSAGFREARRVLKPGGRLLFNVWGPMPHNPVFHSMELALEALLPDEPTPIMPTPCNMADPEPVKAMLHEAGFQKVQVDRVKFDVVGFPALDVFRGFTQGTPISTFLAEQGFSLKEAEPRILPALSAMLGDPLDTTMTAFVYEAE